MSSQREIARTLEGLEADAAFAFGRGPAGGLSVIAANAALERLSGLAPADAAGGPLSATLAALGVSEPADRLLAAHSATTRTVRGQGADGASRWWELSFQPLAGDAPRWLCFVRDVTARTEAANALGAGAPATEAPAAPAPDPTGLDAVIDAMPDGVAILRPDSPLVRANAAAMALLGVDSPRAARTRLTALAPGALAAGPARRVSVAGREVLLSVTTLGSGALLCLLREEADADGPDAEEYLATICHEMRTPLSAIVGALDLLAARGPEAPVAEQLVTMAQRNCRRLQDLADDLLAARAADRQQLSVDVTTLEAADVMAEALEANRGFALQLGVRLKAEIAPAARALEGDPRRLQQVLTNLISNAVKFSPAGATVRLSAVAADGCVEFRVSDSGPGIPESYRERVFERFVRTPDALATKVEGSGLGLAITRDLVERQCGEVTLTSHTAEDGPGATGTVVSVRLPMARRASRAL